MSSYARLGHLRGNITAKDLLENKASWHKSFHKKFDQDKLDRAKRKRSGNEIVGVNVKRTCPMCQLPEKSGCILYEEKLVQFMNSEHFMLMQTSKKMATELGDTELMAKFEGGDLIALEAKYHLAC